jgi:FkbM family methyltransferase
VFAFEPDPGAYDGLQAHVKLNGVAETVTIESSAIADGTKSRLPFAIGNSSGVSRMVPDAPRRSGSRDVEATSIDRYCAARGIVPRVIKIDVEGAELQALKGARRTIAAAGADVQLFVEMHPRIWPELGITTADILAECAAQGLVAERLDDAADDLWQLEGVCLRLRPARP